MKRIVRTPNRLGPDHSAPIDARTTPAHLDTQVARARGQLFVVATPIGNLADLSARAIATLKEVEAIYCEDTRTSQVLTRHYDIRTALISLHEHNETARVQEIANKLLAGRDIALISDAGTPLISDPGYRLVSELRVGGFSIIAIPGASAVIAALSICGLPTDRFAFEGFLPSTSKARRDQLRSLALESRTLVFFESSHRIADLLSDLNDLFGIERLASVVKEITKQFEQCYTETLGALTARFLRDDKLRRGEFVVIVAGAAARSNDEIQARRLLSALCEELPPSQAAKVVAKVTGLSRRDVYGWMETNEPTDEIPNP